MNQEMISFLIVTLLFLPVILYLILILYWNLSWALTQPNTDYYNKNFEKKVTVIVPFRNESENIENIISRLIKQSYPANLTEIILSDDYSDDDSLSKAQAFILQNNKLCQNIRIVSASPGDKTGKKEALLRAIEASSGTYIITTDADCDLNQYWVESIMRSFRKTGADMVTGFVSVSDGKSLISVFEQLEYLSLSATAAVSVMSEKPLLCSGANLAFTKKAFLNAGGYTYGESDASGDDTYLMLKISRFGKIVFNNDKSSIVFTKPNEHLSSIISQRLRWSSKIIKYDEKYVLFFGILLFLAGISPLLIFFMSLINQTPFALFILAFSIKFIADLILLTRAALFVKKTVLLWLVLPFQFLAPLYNLIAITAVFFSRSYTWKGRVYKAGKMV
jgi:cellulose synthase/poly-beta-1,6-N-acetylglucosamine synthase-like glycosyltransferase